MPRKPALKPHIGQLLARRRGSSEPEPGYFRLRLVKGGPWVPARITWCDHEPDNPENILDTGPYLAATIGARDVDPYYIRERGTRIDEAEYRWRMDLWNWALANPGAPEATPDQPVDLRRKPALF
jgi:hypothetical protein